MTRPETLFPLFAPVEQLKGIGPKMVESLERIHITRIKDLIFHLPFHSIERVRPQQELQTYLEKYVTLEVLIGGHKAGRMRQAPYRVRTFWNDIPLDLTYFHAHAQYLAQLLPMGDTRIISGKLEKFGDGYQVIHPDYVEKDVNAIPTIEARYGLTEGISQKKMRNAVRSALATHIQLPEWHRDDIVSAQNFPSFEDALNRAHYPQTRDDILLDCSAIRRLAFDELLSHQLALAFVKAKRKTPRGKSIQANESLIGEVEKTLGFSLTEAQKRAAREVFSDFSASKRMFRMLQGDVGAGKTAVALIAMVAMKRSGFQSSLLAPTEILARQHYEGLRAHFEALDVSVVFLHGGQSSRERREILAQIQNGTADAIIGTHALFQEEVVYAQLGLAVIDEQHRFGVRERMRLAEKGQQVDLLSMSATPIPRSLSMVIHGEMDISILDEKPKGRKPIETSILSSNKLDALVARIQDAVAHGRQVYWVCPLVSESEVLDFTAAEERFRHLSHNFEGQSVAIVHGQMRADEKQEAMEKFRRGEAKVLVATTVIEVGVDVPSASIMVIEGAERFGLAQLHQLRGRVGRGDEKSHCILLYSNQLSKMALERLELMRSTNDGFELAEADLKMRGAGDLIGTVQSGLPRFLIADLEVHSDLINLARDDAKLIIETDPLLQSARGQALRTLLYLMERDSQIAVLNS